MTRVTINDVNRALRAASIDGRLRRGRGYFYFTGKSFEHCYGTSVYVFQLESFTIAGWVDEAKRMIVS